MKLKIEDFDQFIHGCVSIYGESRNTCSSGCIDSIISLENGILKIKLLWAMEMVVPPPDIKWKYTPRMTDFTLNLEDCELRLSPTEDEGLLKLYSKELDAEISFSTPDWENGLQQQNGEVLPEPVLQLIEEKRKKSFSELDITKIPKIDFEAKDIPCENENDERKFMRIDMKWKGEKVSFIRINKKDPLDAHITIKDAFLKEVGLLTHLFIGDVEDCLGTKTYDAGFIKIEEGNISVYGKSTSFPDFSSRVLTKEILAKELNMEVDG